MTTTYYFGDSLTDQGNLVAAATAAAQPIILQGLLSQLPGPPDAETLARLTAQSQALAAAQTAATLTNFGPEGAVSNEFTHPGYAAQLGRVLPENYAIAGARALGSQEIFGQGTGFDANLGAQIDRFLADTGGTAASGSHAVILIGSNDFSDVLASAQSDPDATLASITAAAGLAIADLLAVKSQAIFDLAGAGISTVHLATLPPARFFPAFDGLPADLSALADQVLAGYNALLAQTAGTLSVGGLDVRLLDIGAIATAITEDPSAFGIIAPRDTFSAAADAPDSDQVAFFDPLHPAEAIQQAWGAFIDVATAFDAPQGLVVDETILGDETAEFATGGRGEQIIFSLGGDDTVHGGGGSDVLFSGSGSDNVFGGSGNDIISGGTGRDVIIGGRGHDLLSGGAQRDIVHGRKGDDVLVDGLGNDLLLGGAGDDVFIFTDPELIGGRSGGSDRFRGGSGDDTLFVIVDADRFSAIGTSSLETVLDELGVRTNGIETIVAINGRAGIEDALSGYDWFEAADFWGLVSAPTSDDPIA